MPTHNNSNQHTETLNTGSQPAQSLDLWIIPFEPNPSGDQSNILSPDELARADRFHYDHLRDFYIFCRSSLRRVLATYLEIFPAQLHFGYAQRGKPFLPAYPQLHFNASHSRGPQQAIFACAIAPSPIGLDIEHHRPMPNAELHSIAQHFFSPAEQAHLASLPAELQNQAFFECWTRKEAIIKATGEGVSRPLDSFEVAFGPGTSPQLLRLDHNHSPTWQMASFEPAPGYIGAIASPHPWHHLHLRTLPPPAAKTD